MNSTHRNPFGNLATACIACGKPPGLPLWHFENDLLCWSCWQRVEHLGHSAPDIISSCRAFRCGATESLGGLEHDDLVAVGLMAVEF